MRRFLATLTGKIIAINVSIAVVSLGLRLSGVFDPFSTWFPLSVAGLQAGHFWEPFTYMWVHAQLEGPGMLHLFFNMLALYLFGTVVERELGPRGFLYLYIPGGLVAAVFYVLAFYFRNDVLGQSIPPFVSVVGASGAVLAVAAAFAVRHPNVRLFIIPIPFPIRARYAVGGFVVFSVVCLLFNWLPFIAHSAHIGGALWGYFFLGMLVRKRRKPYDEQYIPYDELIEESQVSPPPLPGAMPVEELSEDQLRTELDTVLEKISKQGINSLNLRERQILDRARALFS